MSKLFIYYSLSGNGDLVSEEYKKNGYEIRKVTTAKPMPKSMFGCILKGGFEAGIGKKAVLNIYDKDISEFNEITVCFPIWNGRPATAANTIMNDLDLSGKKLTFVLCSGGGEAPKTEKLLKEKYDCKIIHLKEVKKNPSELKKLEF